MGFPKLCLKGGELVENSGSNHKMLLLAIYDFVIKYDYNIYGLTIMEETLEELLSMLMEVESKIDKRAREVFSS